MSWNKNVVKHGASGKKGLLSCCKCSFEWIGANLAHIQAQGVLKKVLYGEAPPQGPTPFCIPFIGKRHPFIYLLKKTYE